MVDSADLGFYGAAWRFTDFRQQLSAGSVYLQFVLKSCELPGLFRSSPRSAFDSRRFVPLPVHRLNGANGISDIEGKAARARGEGAGKRPSFNRGNGLSEIEGKAARVAAREWSGGDASDIEGQTERSKCGRR